MLIEGGAGSKRDHGKLNRAFEFQNMRWLLG